MKMEYVSVFETFTTNDTQKLGNFLVQISELQNGLQNAVFQTITAEIKTLALRETNSILPDHTGVKACSLTVVMFYFMLKQCRQVPFSLISNYKWSVRFKLS